MKILRLLAAAGLLLGASLPAPAAPNAAFDQWTERFAADWVRADPSTATATQYFSGAEQDALDRQLTPISPAYRAARVAKAKEGLAALAGFEPRSLDATQRISADMLQWQLEMIVQAEPFADYRYVFQQFSGLQVGLVNFLSQTHPIRNKRDVENYLARLDLVAAQMDEGIAQATDRATRGFVPPKSILVSTIAQFDRFLSGSPRDNVLVSSLDERAGKLKDVTAAERAAFVATAEQTVGAAIIPSFQRARALLQGQLATAGEAVGIGRFPGGDKAYAQALRQLTTTDYTPAEIHAIGLKEVERIETEMDGYLKQLGYTTGSIKERMEQLDAKLQPPAEPDPRPALLARYDEILHDAEQRSESLFDLRPKARCVVKREPIFTEKTAAAHYTPPARDGSRPGIFWAPLPGPRFRTASMKTLVYHEAIPGHHFQLALQAEMADLPRFRRDRVFGGISAHSEGWALYAESLAAEAGWYEGDIAGHLGQLNDELFRARRLVVDTGMHAMGWSREQALAYGLPVDNPVAEVERYIVWPGQACSYKMGMLKILALRARAQQVLGPRFGLKEFHNTVLRAGSVPLTVLEHVVENWTVSANTLPAATDRVPPRF
jgi:uncharacterized protein (DUF885 family)